MVNLCPVIDVTAGGSPCPTEPQHHLIQGCIHEHVRAINACATHTHRLANGAIICRACLESSDPHHCPVTVRVIS